MRRRTFLRGAAGLLASRFGSLRGADATGAFRVAKSDARWWIINPGGGRFLALGVNHAGLLKQGDRKMFDYEATIFFKRYGRDWAKVYDEISRLYRAWGFNCGGYDAPQELWPHLPFGTITGGLVKAAFYHEQLEYADVFDARFASLADDKARLAAQAVAGQTNHLGYFWTDCTCWDMEQARRSHGSDWVSWMRLQDASSAGKRRYLAFLRERFGGQVEKLNAAYGLGLASLDALASLDFAGLDRSRPAVVEDDREFLRLIARAYFRALGEAFRRHAPRGLIFGERFRLRDHPPEVLAEALPYIDVLAIQLGDHHHPSPLDLSRPDETWFDGEAFDRLHAATGKPILLCDHQCGFFDPATPQTGFWYQYPNAAEAASSYDKLLHDAFARPYIVGYFRCQLISAWVERARHYKQGLLRPDGAPFDEYLVRIARTNREILARATAGEG